MEGGKEMLERVETEVETGGRERGGAMGSGGRRRRSEEVEAVIKRVSCRSPN